MKTLAKHMADEIGHGMSEKCERHAEIAEEYFQARDKWISVKNELPNDVIDYVLVVDEIGGMDTVLYNKDEGFFLLRTNNKSNVCIESITHWRHLPSPPNEENRGEH